MPAEYSVMTVYMPWTYSYQWKVSIHIYGSFIMVGIAYTITMIKKIIGSAVARKLVSK